MSILKNCSKCKKKFATQDPEKNLCFSCKHNLTDKDRQSLKDEMLDFFKNPTKKRIRLN